MVRHETKFLSSNPVFAGARAGRRQAGLGIEFPMSLRVRQRGSGLGAFRAFRCALVPIQRLECSSFLGSVYMYILKSKRRK